MGFEELATLPDYDPVLFLVADTDRMPTVAQNNKLQSLPSFLFLLKGEPIVPGFSGSNYDKFKFFLDKAFAKRNEMMAEYDAAKAAQEDAEEEDD
eukprot:NODE_7103_length_473_cov_40.221698_g6288_i0.p2 GENE.NODE_7103_length_473_cov_40.221698_g6288_i0~~NODE_7103_length_473_cov_40.221698_g6288_i0.p2  ORF type:complete len:102 (+),score=38.75 NODE_7103_length_473_cov_40.221698_g6288_i0:24-308(+)